MIILRKEMMFSRTNNTILWIFTLLVFFFSGGNLLAENPIPKKDIITHKTDGILEKDRKATLHIKFKGTTIYPNGTNHSNSTETDTLIVPAKEGKITARGHYTHHGNMGGGYVLSGSSRRYGYVKNNELILTAGEWFWRGESMKRTEMDPHVHIPLENGAKVTYQFHMSQHGAVSHLTGIFTLDIKDTQVWEVTLTGYTSLQTRNKIDLRDKNSGKTSTIDYLEKGIFNFTLKAKFTIKKHKGIWQYKSGIIERARVNYSYSQTPKNLYKILSKQCTICDTFSTRLEGKSITGEVIDNYSIRLNWPDIRPELHMETKMLLSCIQEGLPCKSPNETTRNFVDESFLDRASGHELPITNGGPIFKIDTKTPLYKLQIEHKYILKQVK